MTARHSTANQLPRHILVGYWHNWQDDIAFYVRLRNISAKFDVINVAFALPDPHTPGRMRFTPYRASTVEMFKSDIAWLQQLGKKVLISCGGASGPFALKDVEARDQFVESITGIVREYGFDGIDINLEQKIQLEADDRDFRKPISPSIVNLIEGIQQIRNNFEADFILSLAPESICVQGGHKTYGGVRGSYLPLIYGLREILTYVHVQHYNTHSVTALDGKTYAQGTADYHVAMTEMLLHGFPVDKNCQNLFPMLEPEQVVIGLPALAHAADNGYTTPAEIQKALDYLTKGESFGGNYILREPLGYPALRGIMTWSINWDAASFQKFSSATRACLDTLP